MMQEDKETLMMVEFDAVAANTQKACRLASRFVRCYAELVKGLLSDRATAGLEAHGGLDDVAASVAAGEVDPYTAAENIVATL